MVLDDGMTVASTGAPGPTIPAEDIFAATPAPTETAPAPEPATPASEGVRVIGVDPVPLTADRTALPDPAPTEPATAPTETAGTDTTPPAANETAVNPIVVETIDPAGNRIADGDGAGAAMGGPLVPAAGDPPAPEPAPATTVAETTTSPPATGMTTATATTWVNLHTGPDNGTPTILVVPQGAELQVVACDPWCEVYYDGNHGYIWQDFVTPLP